jgi:two-component system alkaline phosphatase synthesis response regulator PhoP
MPSPKRSVLTIDDRDDIRRLILITLEFKGYRALEASSGPEGLVIARAERPDLILLDVMMPGTDGLTVARTLAADPALRSIPVILLTALGRRSDIDAGIETGVCAYVVKPFEPLELLSLIEQSINDAQAEATAG